ncbi:hypothetical protein OKHIL_77000 [Mycolicibacterium mageritense]
MWGAALMGVVSRPVPSPFPDPPKWEDRDKWIAQRLVREVVAARPKPDNFVPEVGVPAGQDIQLTPGAYTYALIAPGEWPTDSETALEAAGEELAAQSRRTGEAAEESNRQSDAVFDGGTWVGEGAEAARAHYKKQHATLSRKAEAEAHVGAGYSTLGNDVRTIKQKIRDEHDTAHAEIERTLRFQVMSGGPVGVAAIVAEHRPKIAALATELHGHVARQTSALTRDFPETPQFDGDPRKGTGIGDGLPTDGPPGKKDDLKPPPSQGTGDGVPTGGKSSTGGQGTTGGGSNGIGDTPPSAGVVSPPPSFGVPPAFRTADQIGSDSERMMGIAEEISEVLTGIP